MPKSRSPQKATQGKSQKAKPPAKKRPPEKKFRKVMARVATAVEDVGSELVAAKDAADEAGREATKRRSRAASTVVRVAYIAKRMRDLTFERGKTGPELAKRWSLSEHRLRELTAEASAIVREEVCDPDDVQLDVASALRRVMKSAVREGDYKAAVAAAKTWAQLTGAMAPTRVSIKEEPTSSMSDEELNELAAEAVALLASRKKAA